MGYIDSPRYLSETTNVPDYVGPPLESREERLDSSIEYKASLEGFVLSLNLITLGIYSYDYWKPFNIGVAVGFVHIMYNKVAFVSTLLVGYLFSPLPQKLMYYYQIGIASLRCIMLIAYVAIPESISYHMIRIMGIFDGILIGGGLLAISGFFSFTPGTSLARIDASMWFGRILTSLVTMVCVCCVFNKGPAHEVYIITITLLSITIIINAVNAFLLSRWLQDDDLKDYLESMQMKYAQTSRCTIALAKKSFYHLRTFYAWIFISIIFQIFGPPVYVGVFNEEMVIGPAIVGAVMVGKSIGYFWGAACPDFVQFTNRTFLFGMLLSTIFPTVLMIFIDSGLFGRDSPNVNRMFICALLLWTCATTSYIEIYCLRYLKEELPTNSSMDSIVSAVMFFYIVLAILRELLIFFMPIVFPLIVTFIINST
ncbi:hypothetical protein BdWA1_000175 [Babesia duncani]|uniref:Uncharacterized protein n=1 Tax=Babesia duncani TaxID=323732 RepID=A0AAD9PLN6_9APIC|nr:hypothetical protein BdWA1_000175 [Babesia duncani]